MANKTYQGSCKCGGVKFEVELDLSAGTTKCNCTSCWKQRWWSVRAKPEAFRSLAGEELLSVYRPGATSGHGGFCKQCGVTTYRFIDAAEWNDGAYMSLNVAALDNLEPAELLAAPVQYCDGKNDDWWHAPSETRHL